MICVWQSLQLIMSLYLRTQTLQTLTSSNGINDDSDEAANDMLQNRESCNVINILKIQKLKSVGGCQLMITVEAIAVETIAV